MSGTMEIVLPDGTVRRLGNNEPPAGLTRAWPVYGDSREAPMVARSQWDSQIAAMGGDSDDPFLPYVHDQDGIGQCNCDATAGLAEYTRARQGLPFVKLSAGDLYNRINRGGDNGSLLEDAVHEMLTNGIGTAETCGTLWRRGMKTAGADERGRFKALEVFLCPTFDHVMSAVLCKFGIVSGVPWFNNYTPDSDGWLPPGRGGGGGHAILGYKPTSRNGRYGIWHQNSWGIGFGIKGRFVLPEGAYGRDIGGWWAMRSMVDEGGVLPTIKS